MKPEANPARQTLKIKNSTLDLKDLTGVNPLKYAKGENKTNQQPPLQNPTSYDSDLC